MTVTKTFSPTKAREVSSLLADWSSEIEVLSERRAKLTLSRQGVTVEVLQHGEVVRINGIISLPASASAQEIADAALRAAKRKAAKNGATKSTPLPDAKELVRASGGKLKIAENDLFYQDEHISVYGELLVDGQIRLGLKADPETVRQVIAVIFRKIPS